MSDPDMGNWTYSYDVLGEMLSQKDAKGQTSTVSYDKLGRMLQRQEISLTSTWTYDTATRGIGKIASESSSNGFSRAYTYDNYGRQTQTTTTIGTASFTQTSEYDAYGRVLRFTEPSGFAVLNVYNANGYLAEVHDAANQKPLWTAKNVDAAGRISLEQLGNNLYTQRSFDALGRPTHISTGKFGVTQSVQDLYLTHDFNGNLVTRDDYANNQSDSFIYDELDRLVSDIRPDGKNQVYQYDEIGNITFKTGVGSYTYGAKPHAVTKIGGGYNTGLAYDANGNQTSGINNHALAYTAWNMPSKIVQGIGVVQFDYDSNHERFRQIDSSGTTIFLNPRMDLGGHFEQTDNAGVRTFRHTVYAAGKAIAEVVTTPKGYKQTRYFHTDHLGSVDAVTDDNANVLARYAFDPFGNRSVLYGDITVTDHGFTGHEHLPDVGLINMNGRVYDPITARFLSADPSIQAPGNLQSYNRYSYVMNNPLVYTDPSGFSWLSHAWHSVTHAISQAWQNPIVRSVVAIAVSYVTYGVVSGWVSGWMLQSAFGCSIAGGIQAGIVSGAAGGAAAGFTAGFIGSNGDLRFATNAALAGALSGGVSGYFGNSWGLSRIAANSAVGGLEARLAGDNFFKGFEFAAISSLAMAGWNEAQIATDKLKLRSCQLGYGSCLTNDWGELLTDGGRGADKLYFPEAQNAQENIITSGGMADEGGAHLYSTNSYIGRFVNQVSKVHDWMNSDLSRVLSFQGYNPNNGLWIMGSESYNTAFQLYSFTGMLPAAAYTVTAQSAVLPVGYLTTKW